VYTRGREGGREVKVKEKVSGRELEEKVVEQKEYRMNIE
jgi:hypothetical protein